MQKKSKILVSTSKPSSYVLYNAESVVGRNRTQFTPLAQTEEFRSTQKQTLRSDECHEGAHNSTRRCRSRIQQKTYIASLFSEENVIRPVAAPLLLGPLQNPTFRKTREKPLHHRRPWYTEILLLHYRYHVPSLLK